jgi:hypothetical protein
MADAEGRKKIKIEHKVKSFSLQIFGAQRFTKYMHDSSWKIYIFLPDKAFEICFLFKEICCDMKKI